MKKALAIVLAIPMGFLLVYYLLLSFLGHVYLYGNCDLSEIEQSYSINAANIGLDFCSKARPAWILDFNRTIYFTPDNISEEFIWGRMEVSRNHSRVMIKGIPEEGNLGTYSYTENGFDVKILFDLSPAIPDGTVYVYVLFENTEKNTDGVLLMSSNFNYDLDDTVSENDLSKVKIIIDKLIY